MPVKVLVVDDEETTRDSCAQVLQREGYSVLTASGAEAGLVMTREQKPDVVVVDLRMPGMNGDEFLGLAREIDPLLVPVVITGYATVESAVEAMRLGAYDFLPKPFTPDELRLVTRRGVEKRHLTMKAAALEKEKRLMQENFMAIIAHQLRSPLASLQEQLETVVKGYTGELTDKAAHFVENAYRKACTLMHLLDRWLLMTRIDTGTIELRMQQIDLVAVLERVVEAVRKEPGADKLDISLEAARTPVEVMGDPEILPDLFFNLVSNAVKYTPPSRSVRVRVESNAREVTVSVEDTGVGISKEDLALIFEPFHRAERTKGTDGCGLGLAIAKRIAEAHGGRIAVVSVLGQGSCFKVLLPKGQRTQEKPSRRK